MTRAHTRKRIESDPKDKGPWADVSNEEFQSILDCGQPWEYDRECFCLKCDVVSSEKQMLTETDAQQDLERVQNSGFGTHHYVSDVWF